LGLNREVTGRCRRRNGVGKKFDNISVSIKEYFNDLLGERDKRFDQRFDQQDRAVTKAEVATEKRFEGVNEFRKTLADQQRTFIPRQEAESMFKNINVKLGEYCSKLDRIENMKQGGNVVWAYVLAGISIIIAIVSFILKVGGS
jgi:hypothetical protein